MRPALGSQSSLQDPDRGGRQVPINISQSRHCLIVGYRRIVSFILCVEETFRQCSRAPGRAPCLESTCLPRGCDSEAERYWLERIVQQHTYLKYLSHRRIIPPSYFTRLIRCVVSPAHASSPKTPNIAFAPPLASTNFRREPCLAAYLTLHHLLV